MFHRLCPWQGNKQAPREQSLRGGVEVEGTVLGCERVVVGCGGTQGMGGVPKARGLGLRRC